MPIKIITNPDDNFYRTTQTFLCHTIYHTKMWHSLLKKSFKWNVNILAHSNNRSTLDWFIPFITKKNTSFQSTNVTLPLSHYVPLCYNQQEMDSNTKINLNAFPLFIHAKSNIENASHTHVGVITKLDLRLFKSTDQLFSTFNKSSIQRKINKCKKNNYTVTNTQEINDYITFDYLQAITRKRQGSPTFPLYFFSTMKQILKDKCQLYAVFHNNTMVAGIIFIYHNNNALYGYGASLPDKSYWRDGVNQRAMWHAIEDAYVKQCHTIDFGFSPESNTTLRKYKEKWGGASYPLYYTYCNMNHCNSVNRESLLVKTTSFCLKHLPMSLYKKISPVILTLAS